GRFSDRRSASSSRLAPAATPGRSQAVRAGLLLIRRRLALLRPSSAKRPPCSAANPAPTVRRCGPLARRTRDRKSGGGSGFVAADPSTRRALAIVDADSQGSRRQRWRRERRSRLL